MFSKFLLTLTVLMLIVAQPIASQVSHVSWTAILKKNVSASGNVDYRELLKDRTALDAYLQLLSVNPPKDNWTVNEQKAYWINAYNAFTIKLILQNYPVKSIKSIGGFFKSPWDVEFINIDGTAYTLNHIEHEILRKEFDDPRIHFAIVCASRSCPNLRNEAFDASRLDTQLDEQATAFINDISKNKIFTDEIEISKIFDWFKNDFTANKTLIEFLNKYSKTKINPKASVSYLSYDWSLNE
ncbi:DUF547 domain-containing protein [bacterium]|nr:DUF547 domain-containing protein [bacterium]